MRGVVEAVEAEESEEAQAALDPCAHRRASPTRSINSSRRGRAKGSGCERVIEKQLATIESLVERATNASARQPEAIAARLAEQIARLTEGSSVLDPDGCIKRRCCLPPRPTSRRSSTACGRMSLPPTS